MSEKKIIIFDAQEPSIVCSLSHFLSKGYELKSAPIDNIEPLLDNPHAWLLNVKPTISSEKTDFDIFLDIYPEKNISLQHLTNYGENEDLSLAARIFISDWQQQFHLKSLAREIRDPTTWTYSKLAARYGKILEASRTINSFSVHEKIMLEAALEIMTNRINDNINYLINLYPKIKSATENALKKIFLRDSDFYIPNREVAYGYLDNISPLVDFYELRKRSLQLFPYLTVIQFRKNNEEFTWIGSKQVNIRKIFLLPNGNPKEILIKEKFKKVNKYFLGVISELTKKHPF